MAKLDNAKDMLMTWQGLLDIPPKTPLPPGPSLQATIDRCAVSYLKLFGPLILDMIEDRLAQRKGLN